MLSTTCHATDIERSRIEPVGSRSFPPSSSPCPLSNRWTVLQVSREGDEEGGKPHTLAGGWNRAGADLPTG
jgi:hypothetical protein